MFVLLGASCQEAPEADTSWMRWHLPGVSMHLFFPLHMSSLITYWHSQDSRSGWGAHTWLKSHAHTCTLIWTHLWVTALSLWLASPISAVHLLRWKSIIGRLELLLELDTQEWAALFCDRSHSILDRSEKLPKATYLAHGLLQSPGLFLDLSLNLQGGALLRIRD